MDLEIEKVIKIIIVLAVLVIVVVSITLFWKDYIKPYLEDLGKAETAGIKAGFMLPFLLFCDNKGQNTKRYLNSSKVIEI